MASVDLAPQATGGQTRTPIPTEFAGAEDRAAADGPDVGRDFARAVEVLAEMLLDLEREGDSPSTKSVIRRVRA
jgi:hypothetical protein